MVTQLAIGYGVLKSPATGEAKGLPNDGVAATFILPVHDVYGDVSPYMPPTGNSV